MGILNRLIGDQRKLYQSRKSENYYFRDIEEIFQEYDIIDKSILSNEIVYLRNISGSTDPNSFAGMFKNNVPIVSVEYAEEFWKILWLDLDDLIDFIHDDKYVNNTNNESRESVSADAPNERAETVALEEEKKSPPPIPPAPLPAATARAKDADEAEAIIRAWANGEGRDTVTNWINQALYSEKTHGPVRDEIAKFVGHYATADEYKIFHDPIKFFRNRFKAWLIQAKTYNKPAASNPAPATTYTKPRFLEL